MFIFNADSYNQSQSVINIEPVNYIFKNKEELSMRNIKINITPFFISRIFAVIFLGGLLSSCAMMKAQQTKDTEQLLAAAGFKMKPADTPAKMAHLKTLTQHKIVAHQKDGTIYYIYADASDCQCFYWGQEQSYQNLLHIQEQRKIDHENRVAAEMKEQEYLDWNTMGYDMAGNGMGFN